MLLAFIAFELVVGCQALPTSKVLVGQVESSYTDEPASVLPKPAPIVGSIAEPCGVTTSDSKMYEPVDFIDMEAIPTLLPPLHSGTDFMQTSEERLPLFSRIIADHQNFYSPESLTLMGGGFVVGGVIANTRFDHEIQSDAQSSIRNANSDEWFETFHASKEMGNGKFSLPIFAGSWALGELLPDNPVAKTTGTWGERSMRAFIVGGPPLILFQKITGGSRPEESASGSNWHPFTDNNGVSGHAFMGSLPFITAAKMSDSMVVKFGFYAASLMTPLSRVNDNAHYPSQVALGWWMAYLAASAADATDRPDSQWKFYPYATTDASGVMAEYEF